MTVPDTDNPGQFKKVVYQGTSPLFSNWQTGLKKPRMLRAHVIPFDPQTAPQIAQRSRLVNAAAAYVLADQTERNRAKPLADKNRWSLRIAYISLHMRENPPLAGTQWDAGSTNWLDGATVTLWDL